MKGKMHEFTEILQKMKWLFNLVGIHRVVHYQNSHCQLVEKYFDSL